MRRIRTLLAAAVVVATFSPTAALAAESATPAPPSGIAMTPAIQDRVLGPTEKTASFSVQLANQTNQPVTFSISSNDFNALNQTGGLAFLGSDIREVTNGHGLSGILKLDSKIVTVPANSGKTITARIDDLSKLAPGGHYTAILAQALPDGTAKKGNRVAINQVVSSLIFVETAGQGTKTLTLLPPKISNVSFSLPESLNLVFKATGNTQTIPRGIATISRGDSEVGRGIINENSSLILPGSTRLLPTALTGDKHPWWPGLYEVQVQYRYEGSLGISSYKKTILYVNVQALLLTLLILVLAGYSSWRSRHFWAGLLKRTKPKAQALQKRLIVVRDVSHKAYQVTVVKRRKK